MKILLLTTSETKYNQKAALFAANGWRVESFRAMSPSLTLGSVPLQALDWSAINKTAYCLMTESIQRVYYIHIQKLLFDKRKWSFRLNLVPRLRVICENLPGI